MGNIFSWTCSSPSKVTSGIYNLDDLRSTFDLTTDQIVRLKTKFDQLGGSSGFIRPNDVLKLKDIKENPLGVRFVVTLFRDKALNDDPKSIFDEVNAEKVKMNFSEFVDSFAGFRAKDRFLDKKDRFLFGLLDLHGRGDLGESEVAHLLKDLVPDETEAKELRLWASYIIEELTQGRSNRVDRQQFCQNQDVKDALDELFIQF